MSEPAIRLEGLQKAFGKNKVLRGIDMEIRPGQVTVLMGANGAGKSTLVKVLCGVHRADAGTVMLGDTPFAPESPSQAREIATAVGLDIDVTLPVAGLALADRQLVAIARAMAHKPQVLILDEPTSSLSAAETKRLFEMVERLRDQGVAILYISHRMSDIRRLADRILSMRDGQIVQQFETKPLDYEGAVRAMLGHEITAVDIRIPEPGKPMLELEGFPSFWPTMIKPEW
ncbi:MAG: ATP-binding cassette domain-containing protein [Maritimibacter sp.]